MKQVTVLALVWLLCFQVYDARSEHNNVPQATTPLLEQSGALAPGDATDDDGAYVDNYSLAVAANQELGVTFSSPDFIPELTLVFPDGSQITKVGLASGYTKVFYCTNTSKSGKLTLRIYPNRTGDHGDYRLRIESLKTYAEPPVKTSQPKTTPKKTSTDNKILLDQKGSLDETDPLTKNGFRYDHYTLQVAAGSTIAVRLDSKDFDGFLNVVLPDGTSASDNNSGRGTNAALFLKINKSGSLSIFPMSADKNSGGAYRIRARRAEIPKD